MESAIIEENRRKYHQTEKSCPFMRSPLKEHFRPVGIGQKIQSALKGTYIPPNGISPQTKSFIELCKIPQDKLVINLLSRSLDYFASNWRKMKERTSSRGSHFGHYKAALKHNDLM